MPIDDPGWGDYTPPPAQQQPAQQPQPAPQAPPPAQPPAGGPGKPNPLGDPRVRIGLAVAVVVALAAGAFFMFSGGDDDKEAGDKRPAAAAEGGEGPADVGTLPLQDYIALADQLCSGYAADIQAAQQANDLQALAQIDQAMLDELRKLPPPDQSADAVDSMYNDFQLAIDAIAIGDLQTAQQHASTAQATGVQLGFGACTQ
jgi:hypothetical protein